MTSTTVPVALSKTLEDKLKNLGIEELVLARNFVDSQIDLKKSEEISLVKAEFEKTLEEKGLSVSDIYGGSGEKPAKQKRTRKEPASIWRHKVSKEIYKGGALKKEFLADLKKAGATKEIDTKNGKKLQHDLSKVFDKIDNPAVDG